MKTLTPLKAFLTDVEREASPAGELLQGIAAPKPMPTLFPCDGLNPTAKIGLIDNNLENFLYIKTIYNPEY